MLDAEKRGMGTTLSALLILASKGFVAHVGDSRIYLARAGTVQQITEDHTVYNELIRRGRLTKEQIDRVPQKNAVTRAVGVYERVDVDTLAIDVLAGDKFVLASDGLTGYLSGPNDLTAHLEHEGTAAAKSLIDFANASGGKDNVTVVIVAIAGEGREQVQKFALKREILAGMPLFSRLSERELLRVMQVADVRSFADGETVISEGQRGDELYIVLHGSVSVSRQDEVISRLGPGEHFGEMALIRSVPRSATVRSDGPSELILLSRRDFFEILRAEHEIAVKMLWQFLGVLANRLDQTSFDLQQARAPRDSDPTRANFGEPSEVTSPFMRPRLGDLGRRNDTGPLPPPRMSDRPTPGRTKTMSNVPPPPPMSPTPRKR
jgi:CRP-like cAMP-binding protein